MRVWMAWFFWMGYAGISAQASLSVDKTSILIGEQIRATVTVDRANASQWRNREILWPDSLAGIEIVSAPEWNSEALQSASATWILAFFDTGYVRIPPLVILVDRQGQTDTVITNDVPVLVMGIEPDSTGLREIKAIEKEPFRPAYYLKYLPHALVLLALVAGLYFRSRKRKRKTEMQEPVVLPPLPHEWAYNALEELAAKRLWQQGEIKEHYTQLTAILREYLERRYGIHAMEQISDEIIDQLHRRRLTPSLLSDTGELLAVADLIKFAKADPGVDIHAAAVERVRTFVKETTLAYLAEIKEEDKTAADETVE